jgi:hypothetical protein
MGDDGIIPVSGGRVNPIFTAERVEKGEGKILILLPPMKWNDREQRGLVQAYNLHPYSRFTSHDSRFSVLTFPSILRTIVLILHLFDSRKFAAIGGFPTGSQHSTLSHLSKTSPKVS